MRIEREEIIKLAMRADANGQTLTGSMLREVARKFDACGNHLGINFSNIDAAEKRILLEIGEY